jgi:uncharacterized protein YceK
MSKRSRVIMLASLLALAANGCGTFCNTLWLSEGEGGGRIYGGVRVDGELIRACLEDKDDTSGRRALKVAVAVADIPLSIVADTLTLPVTIPTTVMGASSRSQLPEDPKE